MWDWREELGEADIHALPAGERLNVAVAVALFGWCWHRSDRHDDHGLWPPTEGDADLLKWFEAERAANGLLPADSLWPEPRAHRGYSMTHLGAVPDYSGSLGEAWAVFRHWHDQGFVCSVGSRLSMESGLADGFRARVAEVSADDAESAALALCRAGLLAARKRSCASALLQQPPEE